MVIITTGDGRTTRLSPDGSKIKDQSTGIERRTRWEGDRLIDEISGAGRGKIIETYARDPETHELVVTVQVEGGEGLAGDAGRRAPRLRPADGDDVAHRDSCHGGRPLEHRCAQRSNRQRRGERGGHETERACLSAGRTPACRRYCDGHLSSRSSP